MVEPVQAPQKYTCPITGEIMEDPVIAADGKTYERAAISRWFERNNISPVTGKALKNRNLIENHKLASKISQFNQRNQAPNTPEDRAILSMERVLENKRHYILTLRTTIIYLTDIQEDLSRHLLNCKISNTAGNSASIAGTGMLFTPLTLIGVATIVVGSLTSMGTMVTQYFIEKSQLKRMKKVLIEEEKAAVRYEVSEMKAQYFMGFANFALKGFQVGSRIWKILKYSHTLSTLRTWKSAGSVFTVGKWSSIVAAGKATKFFKVSVIGAGLSALDIIATWTMKNPTMEEFKKQIDSKEKIIENQIKELGDIENANVNNANF